VEGEERTIGAADFDAVIFDLDGVVTRTATVHARAWKRVFDEYLFSRAVETGEPFEPFDIDADYVRYVDGKPRYDGVRSFLASRGIELPEGDLEDGPEAETVCGLGNRKNELYNDLLESGVEVFEDTVEQIRAWRALGLKTAIVSSSKNCAPVLRAAGLSDLFDVRVDGVESARWGLVGKPAPDIFVKAAELLGVEPVRAVVFEDAVAGVQAGRAGGFGWVVGVDRGGAREELLANGADAVVSDLRDLRTES
jgi:trehalose 6-phosphate phosphatase